MERGVTTNAMMSWTKSAVLSGVIMFGLSCSMDSVGSDLQKPLPKPTKDLTSEVKSGATRSVVFAGGCFWCIEGVFEQIEGVTNVVSGYAGGTAETADYKTVCSGTTDHAEVVQITYDPSKISYGTLLQVFFSLHHPTQLNGQGPDWGKQYRSAIFYGNDEEKAVAEAYIKQLTEAKIYDKPIVTKLEPLTKFYPAEDYHQDYVQHNPGQGYVRQWALPKIDKLKKLYPELLKK
jgi:peptide-methionine (S)-S-oxide reductase